MAKRTRKPTGTIPRPFLKWAGGKGQLLDHLVPLFDEARARGRYHEPFVGGGALFFELARTGRLRRGASLSDTNPNLMVVWEAVRDDLEGLLDLLAEHEARNGEDYYYEVRGTVPDARVARAARVVYLNKTAFNGLYRENSKGRFNVPWGRYESPSIRDERNLRACNRALADVELRTEPFAGVLERARPGDVVYFDPPYVPVSGTANFTRYARDDFREADQRELARVFAELGRREVHAFLSNSATPLIEELYNTGRTRFTTVMARRNVNRDGAGRGPVPEALVANFDARGALFPAQLILFPG